MNPVEDAGAAPLKIAVVGGGIAGIVAAWLLSRRHRVTILEAGDYLGGHTNTVVIPDGPDAGTPVDTGFIVCNDRTYPNFLRFLGGLGLRTRNSDMSFGFHCMQTGLQYAGTDLNGLLAQRRNLMKPSFLRMVADAVRFRKQAAEDLRDGELAGLTLGQWVRRRRYSRFFVENYLAPMGAAIWSTAAPRMMQFPAETMIRFFSNHGLVRLTDRPQWMTVRGGSHSYVKAFAREFSGTIGLSTPVQSVERGPDGVRILTANAGALDFDRVVIATHADTALRLLASPTEGERAALGPWKYEPNIAVLHSDDSVMPPNRRAWASWNYRRESRIKGEPPALSVTYDMSRLQGLRTMRRYFVTLNDRGTIDPSRIIKTVDYTHPLYTRSAIEAQGRLGDLNGAMGTYFCGSYHRYGFHEDAVVSAVEVGRHFGEQL